MTEIAKLPERQQLWSEPAVNMRWRAGILEQAWRVRWNNGEETYEWRLVPTVEAASDDGETPLGDLLSAVTDDNRHEEVR